MSKIVENKLLENTEVSQETLVDGKKQTVTKNAHELTFSFKNGKKTEKFTQNVHLTKGDEEKEAQAYADQYEQEWLDANSEEPEEEE